MFVDPYLNPSRPLSTTKLQKTYGNPTELWTAVEAGDKEKEWYGEAVAYWDRQEASYDGVLGGHGDISDADIRESRAFLRASLGPERFDAAEAACGSSSSARSPSPPDHVLTAADCGAGVGRVSEELLLRVCSVVDLVEPSATMIEGARQRLLLSGGREKPRRGAPGRFLQVGLQGFEPEENRYDVIWVQWAMLYLTDGKREEGVASSHCFASFFLLLLSRSRPPSSSSSFDGYFLSMCASKLALGDAVSFLKRAHAALKPNGVLVVKENVCSSGFVVDDSDRSLTRSHAYMLGLFEKANVGVSRHARQRDLPKGLFGVRMYACVKK